MLIRIYFFSRLLDDFGYRNSCLCDGSHGRETNVPLTDKGMAVQTGPTRRGRVIEVDQRCQVLGFLEGGKRVVPRNKDVTGVDTDTETWVIEGGNELDKSGGVTEKLRALTGWCLEQQRTGRCRVFYADGDVGSHGFYSFCLWLFERFADMDYYAAGTESYPCLQILDEDIIPCCATKIDDVLAVHKEGGLEGSRGSR